MLITKLTVDFFFTKVKSFICMFLINNELHRIIYYRLRKTSQLC